MGPCAVLSGGKNLCAAFQSNRFLPELDAKLKLLCTCE